MPGDAAGVLIIVYLDTFILTLLYFNGIIPQYAPVICASGHAAVEAVTFPPEAPTLGIQDKRRPILLQRLADNPRPGFASFP